MKLIKNIFGPKLNFDSKIVTITIVSTLLLMIDSYHRIFEYKYFDRLILYLIIPLIIIIFINRENPKEYGFTLGDWKAGLIFTLAGISLMAPVIWFLGKNDPSMTEYYNTQLDGLPWATFIDLIGWEFFFRGWILFGFARKFGPEAIWLQAVPFALVHIGKPEIETLSTIFGGFVFGWIAWRTRSFVYPFIIHWFISSFIIFVAAGGVLG
ncbi:MAG: CPBP family intramembrane metalloprotease [Anaerolineae bacterium]|nr:CPBP family intramembrane metalloprotease [Anaerolineae bacterium]MDK1118572.1 CPBP family intramembrane metalloprotease [Anaerolineae bacterium]